MSTKQPKIIVSKDQNYQTINLGGAIGGYRPGFFEMIIYSEELEPEETMKTGSPTIKRVFKCRIVADPVQAKIFYTWLKNQIEGYEKTFGEIKVPKGAKPPSPTSMLV